jgi:hypothetical protein
VESLNEQISSRDSFAIGNGAGLTPTFEHTAPFVREGSSQERLPLSRYCWGDASNPKTHSATNYAFLGFCSLSANRRLHESVRYCQKPYVDYGGRVRMGLLIPFRLKGLRTPWGQQKTLPNRPSNCIDHGYSSGKFRIYRRPQAMRVRGGSRT